MPFFFSERLPVPTLKSYCIVSTILFCSSLMCGKDVLLVGFVDFSSLHTAILTEPFCLWALINMLYCCLFVFGKLIQKLVLGELQVTEEQHLQDKFWNFIFYKSIFIFGVINAQSLNEVLCWVAWFSMLGFLHIFGQLCKDRYEYITSSPATPTYKHVKLILLIFCIFLSSLCLLLFAIRFGYPEGINIFAFMLCECVLLGLKSLHILIRYAIQLADMSQTGMWDMKAKVVYYSDLSIEFLFLGLDLLYHFHMLIWANVFLSMASLVLYWNMRTIFGEFKKNIRKHRMYRKILKNVDNRFPLASKEELESFSDHCAICWENMQSARSLPCGHLFHHGCLCSWLQQDISCPTCRRSLSNDMGIPVEPVQADEDLNAEDFQEVADNNQNGNTGGFRNYFFYLDGRHIANWFPSFSIEVFHGRAEGQELNDMAQQLYGLFPHISQEAILEDLRQTGSVESTADNILEGSLPNALPATDDSSNVIADNEERPALASGSVTTDTSLLPIAASDEPPSDYESAVEELPCAEDVAQRRSHQLRPNFIGEARCRYLTKTTSRFQADTPSEPRFQVDTPSIEPSSVQCDFSSADQQPSFLRFCAEEKEERRNVLLEAIKRRKNSSQQPPS